MGRTEVTQGQWTRLEPKNPSLLGAKYKDAEVRPVENLTWNEANDWCKKLNSVLSPLQRRFWRAELPTAVRWQHAARGGIPASNDPRGLNNKPPGTFAWFAGNSANKPWPVAELTPNAWGLYDVLGNVWELCSDRTTSPTGEPARVTCGGSFLSTANQVSAGDLSFLRDGKRASTTGFRVMLSER
jgi:formylglycine-generating enzyme required for sulfatase activity